jgi:hypothetical protein
MLRKIEVTALFVLAICASVMASQLQMLKIVPDAAGGGVRAAGDTIRVEWVQQTQAGAASLTTEPLEGAVYFASTPAGGDLSRYTRLTSTVVSNVLEPLALGADVRKRRTSFVPSRQGGRMGPGRYYAVVASFRQNEGGGTDTLFSDFFNILVESPTAPALISPKANLMQGQRVVTINDLTPQFSWRRVEGVPYYHIMLSDEPLVNMDGSTPQISENINIIWQAITPNTQIAYGAPDPSGTITASPPPLSPGKTYSWMVLNNYGNHMAFSSGVYDAMDLVAAQFRISGTPITAPRVVSPARDAVFNYVDAPTIEFRWTDLDSRANSYLINIFSAAQPQDLGVDGLGEINASLLVWEATVARGGSDTLSVQFDAAGTLGNGQFMWRVYALDNRGAASTEAISASTFRYQANMGRVSLRTREVLGGMAEVPVGFAELRTEVISGPMQAPLAFYTNNNGVVADRDFPAGTYRFTAVKEGYAPQSVVVTVEQGRNVAATIFMSRPEAVLFGRVVSADGTPVGSARVTAVSEWGDTVTAFTGGSGGFTLSCGAASWVISVERAGHRSFTSPRVALRLGDNRDFGDVVLVRNPFALSGVVRNAGDGALPEPLIGARVRVMTRDGVLVDELASTPQDGAYVFYLNSGSYTLTAEKAGFAMFTRNIDVTGSRVQDITLREGAALVNGMVIGRSWVAAADGGEGRFVDAPITHAAVRFWESGARDTFTVMSDATFGRFSISLPVDREYNVIASAAGFAATAELRTLSTAGGATIAFADTLTAMMTISGTVRQQFFDEEGETYERPLGGVDVLVTSTRDQSVAASARSAADGTFEVRGIPDGEFTVGAGRGGFYMVTEPFTLAAEGGRPAENRVNYDFVMGLGDRNIRWDVVGYSGAGVVKVVTPFHRTIPFDYTSASNPVAAEITEVGPGWYQIEAVAESTPNLLELSRNRFEVSATGVDEDGEIVRDVFRTIRFPFSHSSPDTLSKGEDGRYTLVVQSNSVLPDVSIEMVELFHRSEGRIQFIRDTANITTLPVSQIMVPVSFDPAKDGTGLFYYFRVHLSNGDIYGSSKQVFNTFIMPDPVVITRVTVEPGATGEDTLVMPSSYAARFSFGAFYSDLFMPVDLARANIGAIDWTVRDAGTGENLAVGQGTAFAYTTPAEARELNLVAVLRTQAPYVMRPGSLDTVTIPIRVTGSALRSMSVQRRGASGPITGTDQAGFRISAVDSDGRTVSVSPEWSVSPAGAGLMSADGTFTPNPGFVGHARVIASAGGRRAEYAEDGAGVPGQVVFYTLRHNPASDTANTLKGMRMAFPANSVSAGRDVEFFVTNPDLRNHVNRGDEDFRMADSIAFDVEAGMFHRIEGPVTIIFDIPPHLRDAARRGNQVFSVARWFPDSLKWISIENSVVSANGAEVSAVVANIEEIEPAPAGRAGRARRASVAPSSAGTRAAQLASHARYALVTKTGRLSLDVSISPHPFSPYIRPVREFGPDAPEGTCISVIVEAPAASVRSIKVHIYNATGKRVWAVDKLNAPIGENRFWWNGRTSGRGDGRTSVNEEVWTDDFNERNRNRPMVRNGRYFVTVIVTDMKGEQRRVMRPVVVMK